MTTQKFKKIGLRRDKNLSDLSNSTEALNNLLDGLVDNRLTESFISEDLDAIRGVYSYGLLSEDYAQIIDSESKETDSVGIDRSFFPRITFQNKLDKLNTFAGEPRYRGGNGLTASYYDQENVYENTLGIFSGSPYKVDNFWEWGRFEFDNNVTDQAGGADDGVLWEGYVVPVEYGIHTFVFDTTACITVDFETQGYTTGIGTYTEQLRIGITTTLSASGTLGSNTISLGTPSDVKYIGIGQSVSGTGISTNSVIEQYDESTGAITLTPPPGSSNAVISDFSNASITFFKKIGQETRSRFRTYILNIYQPYRVRFRYFIPKEIDASREKKIFEARFWSLRNPGSRLRYVSLYSLDYDFSSNAKGDFTRFIDNSLSFGGGTIGSNTAPTGYVKVETNKSVDIKYQPKTSSSQIIRSSIDGNLISGTNILTLNTTSNIEVGNYIFGGNLPEGTRVIDISINEFVVMDIKSTSSVTNQTFKFIEHRGFVKRVIGSSTGTSFTISSGDTSLLRTGMIMIGSGVDSYTGITTTGSSNSLTISPAQSIGSNTEVYFYQSKGLINDSLVAYCTPASTRCLIVTELAPTGSSIIKVKSTEGIQLNWKVQGFQFDSGTTITNYTLNSITISRSTIEPLNVGGNFTVVSSTTVDTKTLCCPPTDTSPPFDPTETGLNTVPTAPNLKIDTGNIIFSSISAGISTENIIFYQDTDISGSTLTIKTPLTTVGSAQTSIFKILCA